jgi:hypothetical protein
MAFTSALMPMVVPTPDYTAMKNIPLQWGQTSQWATPHMNDLYTQEVELELDSDCKYIVSFFVSSCCLIVKWEYSSEFYSDIVYYNLGEFVETIDHSVANNNIKSYAQYVINGFAESYNLQHCPSYERVEDVDDNFNPVY